MNSELLQLASEANEAAIYLREQTDRWPLAMPSGIRQMLAAVDALTGAIVEEANR